MISPDEFDALASLVGRADGVGDPRPVPAQMQAEAVRTWRDLAVLAHSTASTISDNPWADDVADGFAFLAAEALREARAALFALRATRGCGAETPDDGGSGL